MAAPWWQSSVNVESKIGTDRSIQSLDVMYPLSHTSSSLTFTDLRGRIDDDQSVELNLGLARRSLMDDPLGISGEAVLGYYGFADRLESQYDNTFYQATSGVEYFTKKYSLRVNGYWPENDSEKSFRSFHGNLTGTQIFIDERQNYERPLPGYDVELGRTVRFDGWQFYGRGSYFRFHHSDVAEVEGSRFRAGMQLNGSHPDVYLPEDSQLTLGMEWQDDRVREEQTFGVVRFRMPFGIGIQDRKSNIENDESKVESQKSKVTTGSPSSTSRSSATSPTRGEGNSSFSPSTGEKRKEGEFSSRGSKDIRPSTLDVGLKSWQKDRLTERIERDVDIVTAREEQQDVLSTEPAVLSSTGDTLGEVAVAAAGAGGSGNVQDPTDLATAVDRAGTDGTVFLVDSGGSFSTTGETIPGGQSVFGGSARLLLETPDGRGRTTFRLGGGRPVVTDSDTSTPTLALREGTSDYRIAGLSFDGGYNAIRGKNLSDVIVRDVKIRNTHRHALSLEDSTDATIRDVTVKNTTQSILLRNLTDATLTNIDVDSVLTRGLDIAVSDNLTIRNVDVRDVGTQGVWINGGDSLTLSNITVKRPGSDGRKATGSTGISLDARNVTANDIDISGAGTVGFLIAGSANEISDVTVTNTDGDGIGIFGSDITLRDATVSSSGDHGLNIDEASNVQIRDVRVRTAGGHGARFNFADNVEADDLSVRDVDGAGIYSTTSSDTITLRNTTIQKADTGVSVDLSGGSLLPPYDGTKNLHFGPNFRVEGRLKGYVFRSTGTSEKLIDPSGTIIAPNTSCRIEGTVTGSELTLDAGTSTRSVTSGNCP